MIDEGSLPTRGVVMSDKPCEKCGYNLRGLQLGGRCPECAAPIRGKRPQRFADNMTDAPMWFLRLMALGFGSMAFAVVGAVIWSVFTGYRSYQWRPLPSSLVIGVFSAFPVLWIAGVVIVTTKRPHGPSTIRDPLLDDHRLRLAARLCQGLFLVTVGLYWFAFQFGSSTLAVIAGATFILSLFGSIPLSVYTSSLADWAGETGVGGRLRASAWMLAVCGAPCVITALLMAWPNRPAPLLILGVTVITGIGSVIGVVLQLASVVQLANTSVWAMGNAAQAKQRELRIAEKKQQEEEQQAAKDALAQEKLASRADRVETIADANIEDLESIPLAGVEAHPADEIDQTLEALRQEPESRASPDSKSGSTSASDEVRRESSEPHDLGVAQDSGPGGEDVSKRPRPKGAHIIERASDSFDPYDVAPDP